MKWVMQEFKDEGRVHVEVHRPHDESGPAGITLMVEGLNLSQ